MKKSMVAMLALIASGCAFYEKKYVSQIVVDGINYRGATYTDGVFYINDEPDIAMNFSCFEQTRLGETVSLIIPLPVLNENRRHESIASMAFSLTVAHELRDAMDLSSLDIRLDLADGTYPLSFAGMVEPKYKRHAEYEYSADLRCGDIQDGTLSIVLGPGKVRVYGVQFEEGVDRDFSWHASLVT